MSDVLVSMPKLANDESENLNHYFKLKENPDNHYTFLPIYNRKYYDSYKDQLATFWTLEGDLDLSKDKDDFEKRLNKNEQFFIKHIMAYFAASDGIVAENLNLSFLNKITFKEVSQVLRYQAMMEDIHSEFYSQIIETVIQDADERNRLYDAINKIPCIQKKSNWARKWSNDIDVTLPEIIIAFACVEGIHFSGSFCAIFWLKKKNVMPGFCKGNKFISRDEEKHTSSSIMLYNDLKDEYKLPKERVVQIVKEAVEVEIEFIIESIPCAMLGMNSDLMKQYINYVADRLLFRLGYDKVWKDTNPFDFMENISVEGKTNMFEGKIDDYNISGVGVSVEDRAFGLDAEF
jgi:ribonucleotide reductase beta subunit family protein with ferritin-like domain